MWQRALRVVLAALMFCSVAGCSVPEDGYVGVDRSESGDLTVYVRTCSHPMDGATLYWPDDPTGANSNEEFFADWTVHRQSRSLAVSWPLLGPGGSGVYATRQLLSLPPTTKNMAIYAWTERDRYSAHGPYQFTAQDVNGLKDGQILIANRTVDGSGAPNKVVTHTEFERIDCSQFAY